ncbi:MAG: dihydropteroate synthase [Candidatus Bipolaricaulaceae bacterium]
MVIGELINSSRPQVRRAIAGKDAAVIRRLARAQVDAGAEALDLNAAQSMEAEPADLRWLVEVVQEELGEVRLCLDTANPEAVRSALGACRAPPIVNSISNEPSREPILELVAASQAEVIGLPMGRRGMPKTAGDRFEEAQALVGLCREAGVESHRLLVDILCMSVASDPQQGPAALKAARRLRAELGVRTCGAVSNVSFGLPGRKALNRAFLAMLVAAGVTALILDPTDPGTTGTLLAAEALTGQDPYCMTYIRHHRKAQGGKDAGRA